MEHKEDLLYVQDFFESWVCAEPSLYQVRFLLKSGQEISKTVVFYKNYHPSWFLNLRDKLNHKELYDDQVVLIVCIRKIKQTREEIMAQSEKIRYVSMLRKNSQGSYKHCAEIANQVLKDNKGVLTDDLFLERAMKLMVEKNQAVSIKKANNNTNFSIIFTNINKTNARGTLLKFGCESEQGYKSLKENYSKDLQKITDLAAKEELEYILDVLGTSFDEKYLIDTKIKEISGNLGEKVVLLGVEVAESVPGVPNTEILDYIHTNGKSDTNKTGTSDKVGGIMIYNSKDKLNEGLVRKIMDQLVWTNPLCLKKNELPEAIIKDATLDIKESIIKGNARYTEIIARKEILKDIKMATVDKPDPKILSELKEIEEELTGKNPSGKKTVFIPEKVLENVIKGKVASFIEDVCFEEQPYMFAAEENLGKITIKDYLKSKNITIFDFVVS